MTNFTTEKRKIILDNFCHPSKQIELEKLKEISNKTKTPFFTFRNLEGICGDVLHLFVRLESNCIKEVYFSAQQSCLITISSSNIICSYLEKKDLESSQKMIINCQKMLKGEEYFLEDYPNLKVFSDITNFPHRFECINLVVKGLNSIFSQVSSSVS